MPKLNATTIVRKGFESVVLFAGEEVPDWASDLVGEHLIDEEPEPGPDDGEGDADDSESEGDADDSESEGDADDSESEGDEPDAPAKTTRK